MNLCPTCGQAQIEDEERAAAEMALAHIIALMRSPASTSLLLNVLRQLQGMRSGAARVIEAEQERFLRGR